MEYFIVIEICCIVCLNTVVSKIWKSDFGLYKSCSRATVQRYKFDNSRFRRLSISKHIDWHTERQSILLYTEINLCLVDICNLNFSRYRFNTLCLSCYPFYCHSSLNDHLMLVIPWCTQGSFNVSRCYFGHFSSKYNFICQQQYLMKIILRVLNVAFCFLLSIVSKPMCLICMVLELLFVCSYSRFLPVV